MHLLSSSPLSLASTWCAVSPVNSFTLLNEQKKKVAWKRDTYSICCTGALLKHAVLQCTPSSSHRANHGMCESRHDVLLINRVTPVTMVTADQYLTIESLQKQVAALSHGEDCTYAWTWNNFDIAHTRAPTLHRIPLSQHSCHHLRNCLESTPNIAILSTAVQAACCTVHPMFLSALRCLVSLDTHMHSHAREYVKTSIRPSVHHTQNETALSDRFSRSPVIVHVTGCSVHGRGIVQELSRSD